MAISLVKLSRQLHLLSCENNGVENEIVEMSTKAAAVVSNNNNGNRNGVDDKDRKKVERNVQTAEKRIADLEKQVADFEKEMAKSNFYNRSDANKVLDKYKATQKELAAEMSKWESALMELEA